MAYYQEENRIYGFTIHAMTNDLKEIFIYVNSYAKYYKFNLINSLENKIMIS